MKKVRIGLIGLGFMGCTHYSIYEGLGDTAVTAVCDCEERRRLGDLSMVKANIGEANNQLLFREQGVKVYSSALELIGDPAVDVVDICCPTPDHAEYAVAALRAGKHVFVEKPCARTLEQAERICAAARQSPGFLNFGMCVRAWPEYRYAYERFQAGDFGALRSATFRRLSPDVDGNAWQNWYMDARRSGGALLDLHLHDTDEVVYFFGRPKAVTSAGANITSQGGIDHVVTLYHYDDGTLVEAEGSWGAAHGTPFEMTFQLICEKATVRLMSEGFRIYWKDGRVEAPQVEAATGWQKELEYFVDCVRKGVKPDRYQSLESVLDAFKVVLAEQQSVDEGARRVTVQY